MTQKLSVFLSCMVLLLTAEACSHARVRPLVPADMARPDSNYMDLDPTWRLRIVVPVLQSGGFRLSALPETANGGTVSVGSGDLEGYRVFHYGITGRKDGLVRLEFLSAQLNRNGTTITEPHPPALPFAVPLQTDHIRLMYLVRVTEADHNMAILGARRLDALNLFTKQIEKDPGVCGSSKVVFCAWVPAGIAVRPEKNEGPR